MGAMKTLNTPEDLEKLKVGETARLGKLRFRMASKPFDEEEYRCPTCGYRFYAEKPPKFCSGCGTRWTIRLLPAPPKAPLSFGPGGRRKSPGFSGTRGNGKTPAKAAVEEE